MLEIKCFATLRKYSPPSGKINYKQGMKVKDVMEMLKIPKSEVKIIFVNGAHADLDTELKDGDRIGLFPAIGGG